MNLDKYLLIITGIVIVFAVLIIVLKELTYTKYVYMVLKPFFLVLFVLYIHKYLAFKFGKILNLDTNDEDYDTEFNENLIDRLFK
jgi:hypothetical protein